MNNNNYDNINYKMNDEDMSSSKKFMQQQRLYMQHNNRSSLQHHYCHQPRFIPTFLCLILLLLITACKSTVQAFTTTTTLSPTFTAQRNLQTISPFSSPFASLSSSSSSLLSTNARTSSTTALNVWWFGGSQSEETFYKGGETDSCELVAVRIERTSSNSRRIWGEIVAPVALEDVWQILTDYDRLSTHVPNLVESKVVKPGNSGSAGDGNYQCRLYQKGAQKIIGFEFGASVTMDMREVVRSDTQRLVQFKCTDSFFFQEFDGEWRVTERVNEVGQVETELLYVVDVRPKGPVPVAALEWRIREDVPTNLRAMKRASMLLSAATATQAKNDLSTMASSAATTTTTMTRNNNGAIVPISQTTFANNKASSSPSSYPKKSASVPAFATNNGAAFVANNYNNNNNSPSSSLSFVNNNNNQINGRHRNIGSRSNDQRRRKVSDFATNTAKDAASRISKLAMNVRQNVQWDTDETMAAYLED